MHLSLETDYAIRCVLHLALNGGEAELRVIEKQMRVYSFQLAQSLNKLVQAGLIVVEDGRCRLLRHARTISLLDIATAIEGELHINRCLEPDQFCSQDAAGSCRVRAFYVNLQNTIKSVLQSATIASLAEKTECR